MANNIPFQEPTISRHQPMVVPVGADRAPQPPIGAVQRVGVMAGVGDEPGASNPTPEFAASIDPYMATYRLGGVIFVR